MIIDDVKTIEVSHLYEHADNMICVAVANGSTLYEIKEQLVCHGPKVYTLDSCDIFRLYDEIMHIGNEDYILKVKNFYREKNMSFK